ncbi:MAG: flagellar export protein FliJ [Acidobacteria bacterium]|nr:flagellar export protein FliJ [Acidobacteriota bacterium]
MKPFVFRLESVLTIWQRREDAALANLQRQQAATATAQRRVTTFEEQRRAARMKVAEGPGAGDPHVDPAWHRNWITHITMKLEAARDEVIRCVANEEAARGVWQKARRDRRVIERLRERALRRHAHDTRRDEMKVMDELAVQGAFRKEGLTW